MAGLKEIRIRIASIKSTQQITSAMKMVSASKLRKAQNLILKLRPYTKKLEEILNNLGSNIDIVEEGIYSKERKLNKVLLIVITSNRGLCGAFNSNIIKRASKIISEEYAELNSNNNLDLLCIGRKGYDYFTKRKYNVSWGNYNEWLQKLNFEKAATLADEIITKYKKGEYDRVVIVYNKFKNAASQVLTAEQYLPIPSKELSVKESGTDNEYIFEPNKEELLTELIPNFLKIQFYRMLLDSTASEEGARMTAMHIATDNASELLKGLKLSYNKERQATITKELLEITGGAEALKG